jgi:hypothetical protein
LRRFALRLALLFLTLYPSFACARAAQVDRLAALRGLEAALTAEAMGLAHAGERLLHG